MLVLQIEQNWVDVHVRQFVEHTWQSFIVLLKNEPIEHVDEHMLLDWENLYPIIHDKHRVLDVHVKHGY